MCFMSVIDEAARHFETETGHRPETLYLTAVGIYALYHDICGINPTFMSQVRLKNGDSIMGYKICLDPELPYGFRLA